MAEIHGSVGAFYVQRRHCLHFDGVAAFNDRVEVTDAPTLNFAVDESFSVTMWVRIPPNVGGCAIIDKDVTGGTGWAAILQAAGTVNFIIDSAGLGGPWTNIGLVAYDDDLWHFFVFMRDGATGRLWTYVDGVADPAGGTAGSVGTVTNAVNLCFANLAGGGSNNEEMYIGESHLLHRLLTAAEITALYNAGDGVWQEPEWESAPGANDGSSHYLFREGVGASINDEGDHKNTGTITGATWVSHGFPIAGEANGGAATVTGTVTNPNVHIDSVVIYDAGIPAPNIITSGWTITPAGYFVLNIPSTGNVTVDYDYYPVVSECGGFHAWTFAPAVDVLDVTDFASGGWKEHRAALKGWTGSADRHWVHSGLARNLGEKVLIKFFVDEAGNQRYEGWGIISGIAPTVEVAAIVEETISFTGDHMIEPE